MTLEFSADWFSHNEYNLNKLFDDKLQGKKDFLEIGSFEGKSSCWFLNKIDDDASLTCIDTWEGSKEHNGMDFNPVYERFLSNTSQSRKADQDLNIMRTTSFHGMGKLIANKQKFDFIYIDGSHLAKDVMTDACMAMQLIRNGGIIVFDDYEWTDLPSAIDRPKMAIDYFLTLFSKEVDLIFSAYQLAIQKRGN